MEIRQLKTHDISRLSEINRSEHVTLNYIQDGDKLTHKAVNWDVPTLPMTGSPDFSVEGMINQCKPYLENGAILLGAFDHDTLSGLGIVRFKLTKTMSQLVLLHVSRKYRRNKVATNLTDEMIRLAINDGASGMYVSATPSESAVDFYMSKGFIPTSSPVKELFDLEPEDIHLIKQLSTPT